MKQPKCLSQAKRETKYDEATSRNSVQKSKGMNSVTWTDLKGPMLSVKSQPQS